MNTLQMRYFVITANHMSFSRAAQELYVSQPAVSKQIAVLEQELGTKLFRRSKSEGLKLTNAGDLYLSLFKSFLLDIKEISEKVKQDNPSKLKLRIGLVDGWALTGEVESAIHRFCNANADSQIEFEAHPFDRLNRSLANNSLDAIFTIDLPGIRPLKEEYTSMRVAKITATMLFSKKHPNANKENLSPKDFKDDCLYLLSSHEAPPMNNQVLCHSLGFEPKTREFPNRESILMSLSIGRGFAVFDEWTRYNYYDDFTYLSLETKTPVVLLQKPNNSNPLLHMLVAELKKI